MCFSSLYIYMPVESWGTGGTAAPQILAKVDLLPIDNNSKKKNEAKKYKPYQIPRKLQVPPLLFT